MFNRELSVRQYQ